MMNLKTTIRRATAPAMAAMLLIAGTSAQADLLARYDFNSAATPYANTAPATPGVTVTDLIRGAQWQLDSARSTFTSPPDGGAGSFFIRGAGLNQVSNATGTAFGTAQSLGAYGEFTVTAPTGQFLRLSKLSFDAAYNTGNAHDLRVLVTASVTGDTFANRLDINEDTVGTNSLVDVLQSNLSELDTVVAGLNTAWGSGDNTMALLGSAFDGVTSVTFRVYGFSINNPTPSTANILRFDNILLEGEVIPTPAALPAGLGLMGLALLRRRRRVAR